MGFANPIGIVRPSSVTVLRRGRTPVAFPVVITAITDGIPRPGKFKWDAALGQSIREQWVPVDHPVEDGPDITDHIRKELIRVQIQGIVSDTPLTLSEGIGALGQLSNRALEEVRKLREMANEKDPIFLATSMGVLEAATIESIERVRNAATGAAIEVAVSFKEIRIVSPLDIPQIEDIDALLFGGQGVVSQGQASPSVTTFPASVGVPA